MGVFFMFVIVAVYILTLIALHVHHEYDFCIIYTIIFATIIILGVISYVNNNTVEANDSDTIEVVDSL